MVSTRIAIFGYWAMGHEVERLAGEQGTWVAARVDPVSAGADFRCVDRQHCWRRMKNGKA